MGKWLAKFSADTTESLPDIPDILPSVSGLSGPDLESLAKITTVELLIPPICNGWLVAYRDSHGVLRGGCEDRERGTVAGMDYTPSGWTVTLTDGTTLPLSVVRAVAQTDSTGRVVAAWQVREHGFDGENALLQ